jgi:hypothetical protein
MTSNPYRAVRRCLRDPDYFQVVAYGFAFALGAVLLGVGPIILGAGR